LFFGAKPYFQDKAAGAKLNGVSFHYKAENEAK
jgi:formyltetrahydrofolate hydrolase